MTAAIPATPFSSVLVANRGEIALRIMRTVRAAGLRTIGVATDVDVSAPHAAFADQLVNIGAGPAGDSYLSIERLLAAAKESGADAVHPGYGFLSENPEFARACRANGLVFIGPSAEAMEVMGDKASAKRAMLKASVPCVPGYGGPEQSVNVLARKAVAIGYPVMIKAATGGGGRGMRLVERPGDFKAALALAKSEGEATFGSGEVILEKAVINARHIEVQIFADRSGHTIHLGERDCSVQRRHQKIIEEAPAPGISNEMRAKMGATAINAAHAVGYEGAGTVEFLLDEQGDFFFLEMNTRLQVEHPVTEEVTKLDLVAMQLAVASGQPLGLSQRDVVYKGHAIEARLYAEDPANGFLPSSGRLVGWDVGAVEGLRVESGVKTGGEVSAFYDPMLAKLIVHAPSREQARLGLISALEQSAIFGPVTNRDFLIEVLAHERFARGEVSTGFLTCVTSDLASTAKRSDMRLIAAAAALLWRWDAENFRAQSCGTPRALVGWSSQGGLTSKMTLAEGEKRHDLSITAARDGTLEISSAQARAQVSFVEDVLRVDGMRVALTGFQADSRGVFLATERRTLRLDRAKAGPNGRVTRGHGNVTAPMHGVLLKVLVAPGQKVVTGDSLAILEAMKMQHEILCDVAGVVAKVPLKAGAQVRAGELLVEITPD